MELKKNNSIKNNNLIVVCLNCIIFFNLIATNGRLCDERIYEEVFVRRDKCLFEKTHIKCTKMPAYCIANVGGSKTFIPYIVSSKIS